MQSIVIKMRDGTRKEFAHEGRAGGSYSKTIRYEGNFVIVRDEWGKDTAFPMDLVLEVQSDPGRSW